MPPNYQNGKVYKIVCNETNQIYIGSTVENLSNRMSGHRSDYKRYQAGKGNYITSFEILKYPSAKILLVRYAACNSKEELHAIEGAFIKNNECVNKVIPGRTQAEYQQDTADQIKERKNRYYQDNAEQIKEKTKQYNRTNKDRLRQKHQCECGGKYTTAAKTIHNKTKKHLKFEKQELIEISAVFGMTVDEWLSSL